MTSLTPAFDAALTAGTTVFEAVQIELAAATIRLLLGSGQASFAVDGASQTFAGADGTYGAIDSIDDLTDGTGDDAPSMSITMLPPSDDAASALCAAANQGCRVRRWFGAIDKTTGAVIADPVLIFDGIIDVPTWTVDMGVRTVELACVSSFELFFENEEGFRLSDSNHQRVWPGETGLANMSGITKPIYWGVAAPSGAASGGVGVGGSFVPAAGVISGMPGFSQRLVGAA